MARSLIVYCCFGSNYARMLNISLHSLLDVGDYRGEILVVTDLDREALIEHCALAGYPTVTVAVVPIKHELTSKLARYRIHNWFDVTRYSPVLYVDCDIVFDRWVAEMLSRVQSARSICFPTEPASIGMWDSMGGDIMRDEGMHVDGPGFNSGTFGVPDGGAFRYYVQLETVVATTVELWTNRRHLFTRWIDQPVVNYLQARDRLFDTDILTPFFRFCFQNDQPGFSDRERVGAVHFFDGEKEGRMRSYIAEIAPTRLPWTVAG